MTRTLPLPAAPDEVTPAWLTTVLRAAGVLREAVVAAVDWMPIDEVQDFTGVVARLGLRYAGGAPTDTAPPTLVAKFPTAVRSTPSRYRTVQTRDAAAARRYFERCAREGAFYREIAPYGPAPAPRLYHGAADAAAGRVVLLLEDLSGARSGDVLAGCSRQEAALVLDAVAPVHANWWGRSDRAVLPWLPRWGGEHQWLAGADPDRLVGRERALVAAAMGDGRLSAAVLDHDAARLVGSA